ncbi:MAG: hypothetical protein N3A01_08490, partial [Bacteroidales bacterium]|nr:hypothetical protein [Bacteroidales bacterium]
MKNLLILVALILNLFCYSQVSISPTGTDPDNSAGLDINFTDKGLLIPRVSLTSTTSTSPISGTPATSLLVYNTASQNDVTPGYYYWNGVKWVRLLFQNCLTPMYVLKTDNSYNVTCSQIYDNGTNVGINTTNPQAKLHVESGQFLTRNENNWSNHVSYVFSNTHHPAWVGVRARGTYTNPQEPQSGDILAHFTGRGIGDPWLNYGGAEITIVAEENFTLSNRGASIHFNTTTNGTNNPTRKMILTNNGMLGIGENYYPQFTLDVKGSARLNNMQTDGARLIWRGGVNGSQEYRARVGTNGQLGFFPIELGNPGYVGEPLVLTQNGRVGINNMQNPQYPLHIGSNGATNTTLLAMSDNSRTFTIQLGNNLG